MAYEALSDTEYIKLLSMINRRYDDIVTEYEIGRKTYEYRVATTLVLSGTKHF